MELMKSCKSNRQTDGSYFYIKCKATEDDLGERKPDAILAQCYASEQQGRSIYDILVENVIPSGRVNASFRTAIAVLF